MKNPPSRKSPIRFSRLKVFLNPPNVCDNFRPHGIHQCCAGRSPKSTCKALRCIRLSRLFPQNLFILLCLHSRELLRLIFLEFAWGFGIEKWRGFFGELLVVSVSKESQHENLKQLGENSEQHSGRKFDKFGELSF